MNTLHKRSNLFAEKNLDELLSLLTCSLVRPLRQRDDRLVGGNSFFNLANISILPCDLAGYEWMARNRLLGEDAQVDLNQSQQLIHQMRLELEELIKILRR